ncbi:MAG: DUF167 domain-containing protein [Planctomycetales bacterium]|nr:DUF167 domain-containing protein [Planctomycetales bacterium]
MMSSLEITEAPDQTIRFRVRVSPGAKKTNVGGTHDGMLKVSVTQAPENGKANQAVIKLISKQLGISKSSVVIVAGQTARIKTIQATGISQSETRRRLAE